MERILDILIAAEFNGTLTSHRSDRCVVGEIIFNAVGFRVGSESWLPILEAARLNIPCQEGVCDLQKNIAAGLLDLGFTIDDLTRLDELRNTICSQDLNESAIQMLENWNQLNVLYV